MAALFTGIYVIAVLTPPGQWVDNLTMHAADREMPWWVLRPSRVVLAGTVPAALLALGVTALLRRRSGSLPRKRLMVFVGVPVVAAKVFKLVILPRPDLLGVDEWLTKPAFPSGHLTVTLVCGGALILSLRSRHLRRLGAVATWLAASAMSGALLATHNHRLSELAGSCLMVAAVTAAVMRRCDVGGWWRSGWRRLASSLSCLGAPLLAWTVVVSRGANPAAHPPSAALLIGATLLASACCALTIGLLAPRDSV